MQTKQHLTDLHESIKTWKSSVDLANDELVTYRKQLAEVSQKNTALDVKIKVEQFQNRFIRQQEVIDSLLHRYHTTELGIADKAKDNPAAHRVLVEEPAQLKEQSETFIRLFAELKEEFFGFLRKVL